MKRMAVLFLVLAMLAAAGLAAAQELATYEFDDFTIDMENDIIGNVYEKIDSQTWFIVYPGYDAANAFHQNMNCVWLEAYADMDGFDPRALAEASAEEIRVGMLASGIACENMEVVESGRVEIDAVEGIAYTTHGDYDYAGAGMALKTGLYTRIYQLSDEYLGTYTFTLTAVHIQQIEEMCAMIESIRWD